MAQYHCADIKPPAQAVHTFIDVLQPDAARDVRRELKTTLEASLRQQRKVALRPGAAIAGPNDALFTHQRTTAQCHLALRRKLPQPYHVAAWARQFEAGTDRGFIAGSFKDVIRTSAFSLCGVRLLQAVVGEQCMGGAHNRGHLKPAGVAVYCDDLLCARQARSLYSRKTDCAAADDSGNVARLNLSHVQRSPHTGHHTTANQALKFWWQFRWNLDGALLRDDCILGKAACVHQLMHRFTGPEKARHTVDVKGAGRPRRVLGTQDRLIALAEEAATAVGVP